MKGVYRKCDNEDLRRRLALFRELASATHEQKIAFSRRVIREALGKGKPALLYSGGRDSTVLLGLAREQDPGILVIHNDTTLGDPGLLEFIRTWTRGMNYRETTAQDPIAMWQETGYFPILSKRGHTAYKKRDPALRISPVQCCYQLKEKHANRLLKAEGVAVVLWGNRATESMRRRLGFADNGFLFKPKKYPWWQAYPLQHWEQQDINRYLEEHAPGYPREQRPFETGCLCCGTDITFWPNNQGRLYQRDPDAWARFMRAGFAREILRAQGRQDLDPEWAIQEAPGLLLRITTRRTRPGGDS